MWLELLLLLLLAIGAGTGTGAKLKMSSELEGGATTGALETTGGIGSLLPKSSKSRFIAIVGCAVAVGATAATGWGDTTGVAKESAGAVAVAVAAAAAFRCRAACPGLTGPEAATPPNKACAIFSFSVSTRGPVTTGADGAAGTTGAGARVADGEGGCGCGGWGATDDEEGA